MKLPVTVYIFVGPTVYFLYFKEDSNLRDDESPKSKCNIPLLVNNTFDMWY